MNRIQMSHKHIKMYQQITKHNKTALCTITINKIPYHIQQNSFNHTQKINKQMNSKQQQKLQVVDSKNDLDPPAHQTDSKTEEEQQNYYQEYCKLHLANVVLSTQLKELNFEKGELIGKLQKLEKRVEELSDGNSGQVDERKRRIRRAASEISRHHKCRFEGCSKSYGSEGSLNQHIKLKHPEMFKSMGHYGTTIVQQSHEDDSS